MTKRYPVPPHDKGFWASVTNIPCPIPDCEQELVWYEAGYVPGYRVCMKPLKPGTFDHKTLHHRFLAEGTAEAPTLRYVGE